MFHSRRFPRTIFLFAFGLGTVLTGCHQIPSTRSNWGGGVGEYTVEDDEIREQWRKAASGNEIEEGKAKRSTRQNDELSEEERFNFVKRFFGKSNVDSAPAARSADKRPERLDADERFFPADRYAADPPALGKIVPLEKSATVAAASSDSVSNGIASNETVPNATISKEAVPSDQADPSASAAISPIKPVILSPQRVVSNETFDLTPLIESINERAAERQSNNAVYFPESRAPADGSEPGASTNASTIKGVTYFEETSRADKTTGYDRVEADAQAAGPAEPQKLIAIKEPSASAATPLTPQAREMIEASPLSFLTAPSAIKPVMYDLPAVAAPNDWRGEVRRAAERLCAEIDRQAAAGELRPTEVARLRLLLVATGDDPAKIGKVAAASAPLAEFWDRQCRGLETVIQSQENGSNESLQRAAGELTASLDTLKSTCPASVRKALFAEASAPFGLYRPYTGSYRPGATAFVYLELDNIVSKPSEGGYEIAVLCRWELLDDAGRPAAEAYEQLCSNRSASPLKDIVLNVPARLSENLPEGGYVMKVAVSDRNAPTAAAAETRLPLRIGR